MIKKYISIIAANKQYLSIAVIAILSVAALEVTIANEVKTEVESTPVSSSTTNEAKTLAYYVANTKEALKKNRECYEKGLDMQNDLDCAYSLHALQISYVGGDKISGYKFNRD